MWRLQLFLILSTGFLIPFEAKPTTTSTPAPTTASSAATAARRAENIGRLAAKDLADLLMASMQARGIKLSDSQESTIKALRDMEATELQGGAVLLQVGMDVIIDVLIGSSANGSCDRVIKDIKRSTDKNSLTLSLKSFLALCSFNGIECSQKQVVQIIKSTTSVKASDLPMLGSRSTRTALQQAGKADNIKGDRETIVSFLQQRSVSELSAILSTLLQVCGASSVETQRIVQNLVEMGPKDESKDSSVNVLQINGFSTLIISLTDSLTSIANGNKSGFCAATPDSWIVRLLDMGVAKVIIMGLMTALDRSLPATSNTLIQQSANLINPDVPLGKDSPTAKRSSGSLPVVGGLLANQGGNSITTGAKNIISGNNNFFGQLVDANIPAAVDANVLTNTIGTVTGSGAGGAASPVSSVLASGRSLSRNIANQGGNTITTGPKNVVTGDNNFFGQLVDANIPAAVGANILTNTVGTVTGSGAGGSPVSSVLSTGSSIPRNIANLGGNTITSGPKNIVSGNNNFFGQLVGLDVPAAVDANVLTNRAGTVTGNQALTGGSAAATPLSAASSARSGNIANKGGNTITTGPKNVITGSGNTVIKGVDLDLVAGIGANVLNTVVGTVTGGNIPRDDIVQVVDRDGNLLMNIWDKDGVTATNVANDFSNTVNRGPKQIVMANDTTILKLVNLDASALAKIDLLNSIRGSSAACNANKLDNELNTGPENVVEGNRNTIVTLLNLNLDALVNLQALNSVIGSVGNDCPVTPEPPTPAPPTPEPPTPEPPTPQPPTPQPPTPYPPTPFPPTPFPPTPQPPTPNPPTPNPNNCYRRYCRRWRYRPSYLCYKNCGGSYVHSP
ncbi:uncharacterized protein LOC115565310 isoform X10 [Drosophila navojoa]|uniref:uncharacterized protein LOC115565310 isoform X10 n=1 Tax=Drosophila navojoa TaxID=7232 RepID=UPI0011BFC7BD|nr:uncharacterized protein LOC115565310 isoform X10 [Drosophila navojoa]